MPHREAIADGNRQIGHQMSYVGICIMGSVATCILTMGAVLTASILRPENTGIVTTLIGISSPITLGLLGVGMNGLHKGVNGRLSQLLQATADRSDVAARASLIRGLYLQAAGVTPGTAEHDALMKRLDIETRRHFDVVEHRQGQPPNHQNRT